MASGYIRWVGCDSFKHHYLDEMMLYEVRCGWYDASRHEEVSIVVMVIQSNAFGAQIVHDPAETREVCVLEPHTALTPIHGGDVRVVSGAESMRRRNWPRCVQAWSLRSLVSFNLLYTRQGSVP